MMHGKSKLDLKHSKAPTKAILGTRQLKPGYGLPINPSHVISSLSRPVYEPPALEVLDMFESKEWEDELEAWEKSIPDVEVRTRYVDLMMELATAVRYGEWVVGTGKEAIERGDGEREGYYEGLLGELKQEVREILVDVARMEAEELPEGYAVTQKVVKLEEDVFSLRPKSTDDVAQFDDEKAYESNLRAGTHRSGEIESSAEAGYRTTMDGVLLLPKFSIQAFTKNLAKGMQPPRSGLHDDID